MRKRKFSFFGFHYSKPKMNEGIKHGVSRYDQELLKIVEDKRLSKKERVAAIKLLDAKHKRNANPSYYNEQY